MKTKIGLFLIVVLMMTSCSDWLRLEPEDGVIRNRYWKTKEETFAALMGCYASLMEDNMMERYFVWGELRADMVTPTPMASDHYIALNNGEIVSSNPYTQWNYFYRTINQCNTVLELGKQALKTDISFSEEQLKQIEAEATCIRSLAYFYLIRTFRDVPYNTKATIYDDDVISLPVSKQDDIVDSLIVSLRKVENDIIYKHNTSIANKGRFNVFSLKALLADLYLWKGDYDSCIDLTSQIIESGQYSLVPVGREEVEIDGNVPGTFDKVYYVNEADVALFFNEMFVNGNSVESIFELQFSTDKTNPFGRMFIPGVAKLQMKAENFSSEFFPSSGLDRGWVDMRGQGVSYQQGYIWKWIGLSKESFTYRTQNTSYSNWIFYRLADIVLMKAEALTQKAILEGNNQDLLKEADKLVRQIRERANAPESTDLFYQHTGDIDGKTMEEFVLNERAREFAFEGKRWFDVLRNARRNNYEDGNLDYLIRLAVFAAPPEKVFSLQNKWQSNSGSHYLPINLNELTTNKKLEQNEFYR